MQEKVVFSRKDPDTGITENCVEFIGDREQARHWLRSRAQSADMEQSIYDQYEYHSENGNGYFTYSIQPAYADDYEGMGWDS